MITLVPLSGGVDSTYALVKLLREMDDEIVVLHIRMANRERRWEAESQATKAIIDYCRKSYRDFKTIETTVDRRKLTSFGNDMQTVSFQAGLVCRYVLRERGIMVDRYVIGYCTEEREEDHSDGTLADRASRLRAICSAGSGDVDYPRFDTLEVVSKAEELAYLGPVVASMCWTCRSPIWIAEDRFEECGECKTCTIMKQARETSGHGNADTAM